MCQMCVRRYYLQIHKNGELLSLYIRLNSEEDNFFMPDDAEISNTARHL